MGYAYHDGANWQIETVYSTGIVCDFISLALDSGGNPHISYNDSASTGLGYAYHDGANWQVEIADISGSVGFVGIHNSLALDSGGNPHISYYDMANENLKYAVRRLSGGGGGDGSSGGCFISTVAYRFRMQ